MCMTSMSIDTVFTVVISIACFVACRALSNKLYRVASHIISMQFHYSHTHTFNSMPLFFAQWCNRCRCYCCLPFVCVCVCQCQCAYLCVCMCMPMAVLFSASPVPVLLFAAFSYALLCMVKCSMISPLPCGFLLLRQFYYIEKEEEY